MQVSVLHAASLSQVISFELLNRWGIEGFLDHVTKIEAFYQKRRDIMLEAANKHLTGVCQWDIPKAGFHFCNSVLIIMLWNDLGFNYSISKLWCWWESLMINYRYGKGWLWAAIFKSAETIHLILLCYLGDAIRCAVSADLKMVARNPPLGHIFTEIIAESFGQLFQKMTRICYKISKFKSPKMFWND